MWVGRWFKTEGTERRREGADKEDKEGKEGWKPVADTDPRERAPPLLREMEGQGPPFPGGGRGRSPG